MSAQARAGHPDLGRSRAEFQPQLWYGVGADTPDAIVDWLAAMAQVRIRNSSPRHRVGIVPTARAEGLRRLHQDESIPTPRF
jgi:hypothetical protein